MIRVQETALDPWLELAEFLEAHPRLKGASGGLAVFVGTMRDNNEGRAVSAMTLEHYPGMTERHLAKLADEATEKWAILESLIVHRVGSIAPGDPIVLVAVWSAHRDAAFAACRYLIDELKTRAPFWKQEDTEKGRLWVTPAE